MLIYNLIAHILSLLRVFLTPAFAICIFYADKFPILSFWAKVILILVGLSDWLDGFIAKRWGRESVIGTFLDPVADKIFLDTSLIVISIKYDLPFWIIALFIARDVAVLIVWSFFLFVSEKKYMAIPHLFGKLMNVFQIATIASAVFTTNALLVRSLCVIAILLSVSSALIYIGNINKYRKLLG